MRLIFKGNIYWYEIELAQVYLVLRISIYCIVGNFGEQ